MSIIFVSNETWGHLDKVPGHHRFEIKDHPPNDIPRLVRVTEYPVAGIVTAFTFARLSMITKLHLYGVRLHERKNDRFEWLYPFVKYPYLITNNRELLDELIGK